MIQVSSFVPKKEKLEESHQMKLHLLVNQLVKQQPNSIKQFSLPAMCEKHGEELLNETNSFQILENSEFTNFNISEILERRLRRTNGPSFFFLLREARF